MGGGREEGEEVEIASSHIYKGSHGHDDGFCRELFQLSGDEALDPANVVLLLRVDRLDNILSAMEGNACTLERSNSCPPRPRQVGGLSTTELVITRSSSLKKLCKPTECVLDEVEEKGTLVERVRALEKRVLKLKRTVSTTLAGGDSLQEVADVEKHEVLTGTSIEHDQHIPKPQIRGEIAHREGHERIMLRGSASTQVQEPTVCRKQLSKKKAKRIKKWLLKQFRMVFPAGTQDKHCWNPHTK